MDFKKILKDSFTEPDNQTFCPIRLLGILGTAQGLTMAAYDVFLQHAHFDLQNYGLGLGATLAALGAALGFKKDTPK
jgi:hypothetical protein